MLRWKFIESSLIRDRRGLGTNLDKVFHTCCGFMTDFIFIDFLTTTSVFDHTLYHISYHLLKPRAGDLYYNPFVYFYTPLVIKISMLELAHCHMSEGVYLKISRWASINRSDPILKIWPDTKQFKLNQPHITMETVGSESTQINWNQPEFPVKKI